MITELRNENQLKVGAGIESFTKRTVIRNLKDTAAFSKEDIGILYDKFFGALYYANHEANGKPESKMNCEIFHNMLASMAPWAKIKPNSDNMDVNAASNVCNSFIDRIFRLFAADSSDQLLDFQSVILGFNEILHGVCIVFLYLGF
jgi:hypothetical protein